MNINNGWKPIWIDCDYEEYLEKDSENYKVKKEFNFENTSGMEWIRYIDTPEYDEALTDPKNYTYQYAIYETWIETIVYRREYYNWLKENFPELFKPKKPKVRVINRNEIRKDKEFIKSLDVLFNKSNT